MHQNYLDDEKSWKQIDTYILKAIGWIKDSALGFLNSPKGNDYLKAHIERVIHKINVTELVKQQVMKLDTDELEKMILDNTGGNLVVIQIIGGILGIIAGFVQVHIGFAIPLLLLIAITWGAHVLNKRHYDKLTVKPNYQGK